MAKAKKVKGTLFLDYIRMLKTLKNADWSKYLTPDDLGFLKTKIIEDDWYPFDTFERMGLAILKEIARGDMNAVLAWGRISIDGLIKTRPDLINKEDPAESLMRFQVLRKGFFDFNAIYIVELLGSYAKIEIAYEMSDLAEQAATLQTLGFFERLLELSGAEDINSKFLSKAWEGAPSSIITLSWKDRWKHAARG